MKQSMQKSPKMENKKTNPPLFRESSFRKCYKIKYMQNTVGPVWRRAGNFQELLGGETSSVKCKNSQTGFQVHPFGFMDKALAGGPRQRIPLSTKICIWWAENVKLQALL